MDTNTSCGGGSSALRDVLMPSTHDGQCRLEMKHAVDMISACGSRNLGSDAGRDMVTESSVGGMSVVRYNQVSYFLDA